MSDERARRYFDNSATSHPKPAAVVEAVADYFAHVHASAGRGAYREAVASGRIIADCRTAVRRLLGCSTDNHIIFTLNGTDALNLAIKGLLRPGDHVVTTAMDHNSVLRPLSALQQQIGVEWTAVAVDPETTRLDPAQVAAALRPTTRLVAVNHASNVTGVLQPIEDIAALCREQGIRLLVDAAQSAGHVPIDLSRTPIDLVALPGHKGLLGPLGTGVLVMRAGLEHEMRTMREGGTGSESETPTQPDTLPDRFEAGSHNAVGIAGLLAGVRWLLERGVDSLRAHEMELSSRMVAGLDQHAHVQCFGPREVAHRVGVFSVRIAGFDSQELAAVLEARYGILARAGLHCAPLAHQTIGTLGSGGTTRLSMGPFNTADDVDFVLAALGELAAGESSAAPTQQITAQQGV